MLGLGMLVMTASIAAAPRASAAADEKPASAPADSIAPIEASGTAEREAAATEAFSRQRDVNRQAVDSQKKIESLDDEAQDLLSRYRSVLTETASYEAYSAQLERSVASQGEELTRIQEQMDRAGETARDVLPLTNKLIDDLDQFIALDLPFQRGERVKRVEGLRTLMGRADVSLSEKYRRVIEAYLIELEFGRTMETYEGVLDTGETPLTVDFLRIGRIALLYQTPDGQRTGYWDKDAKAWVENAEFAHAFKKGVRIASKQDAPDLVIAPVHAAKEM
jgi:hypothetical protein